TMRPGRWDRKTNSCATRPTGPTGMRPGNSAGPTRATPTPRRATDALLTATGARGAGRGLGIRGGGGVPSDGARSGVVLEPDVGRPRRDPAPPPGAGAV